jgi:hypothetical protein
MVGGHDHHGEAAVMSSSGDESSIIMIEAKPLHLSDHAKTWWRPRVPVALSVLLYVVVLHVVYRALITPRYANTGLGYRPPEWWGYTAMVLWVVVVGVLLPLRLKRCSDFLIWMLFCLAGAPSMLLCQYNSHMPRAAALPVGFTVGAAMLILSFGAQVRPRVPEILRPRLAVLESRTFGRMRVHGTAVWVGLLVVAISVEGVVLVTSGFRLSLLNIYDVYAVRSNYELHSAQVPLLGYLVPLTTNVLNPALMARGLMTRRYSWFVVGALGQYTLYGATGAKMTLFSIPALVALVLLFRVRARLPGFSLLLVVVGAMATSVLADWVLSKQTAVDIVVRRLLIVPGALTVGYVEVFRGHPKTFFADSPLKFLSSPYRDVSPPFMVGTQFVGDPGTSANVSLFGHGYLALGLAGILVEAAALLPVLWLLDRAARGLPFTVVSLVLLMPAVALSSASVFTTTLTHGLLAAAVLFALLPRTGWTPVPRTHARDGTHPLVARLHLPSQLTRRVKAGQR